MAARTKFVFKPLLFLLPSPTLEMLNSNDKLYEIESLVTYYHKHFQDKLALTQIPTYLAPKIVNLKIQNTLLRAAIVF